MHGFVVALMSLTPALLAPTEPAPTAVTVAWASAAHDKVVITWQETGDLRNKVDLVLADGSSTGVASKIVEPGQPNQSELTGWQPDQKYRVEVRAIDAAGTAVSDPGASPVFDTDRPPTPVLQPAVPREDGTIQIQWTAGAYTDSTPNDPLDLPAADPAKYIPVASIFDFNDYEEVGPPIAETTFVVPKRPAPVRVGVRTVPNEWGFSGASTPVLGSKITASIPKTAVTGKPLKVTGKATRVVRACDPGPCGTHDFDDPGRLVRLEARTDANAAWQTVATARTGQDGKFAMRITSPGTRQYRVVSPVVLAAKDQDPMAYAATAVTTTSATTAGGGTGGSSGSGGGLAITGPPVAMLAAGGGLLVILGAFLTLAGRTRRRAGDKA
jgi:hypothetical protein